MRISAVPPCTHTSVPNGFFDRAESRHRQHHTFRRGECLSWVIFDRVSWLCLPVDVRFTPNATEPLHCREMTRWANSGLMHRSKKPYSITSSAVASSVCGNVTPSVLAVLRFRTRSNFVGCSTGKSDGIEPCSMLC